MDVDRMFAGMAQAEAKGAGQYFGVGRFLLRTKNIFAKEGFKPAFIAEFEILESTCATDPVGSSRSFFVNMKPDNPYAFSDIKKFLAALSGDNPKTLPSPAAAPEKHREIEQLAKAACDPAYAARIGMAPDALIGLPVRLETWQKPTKKVGGLFTIHDWSPAEEDV